MTRNIFLSCTAVLLTGCLAIAPDDGEIVRRAELRLRREIAEADGFRQVRAVEALGLPCPDFPLNAAAPEVRIGQYRVRIAAGQRQYEAILRHKALDPALPEHLHALESAAKLVLSFAPEERRQLRVIIRSGTPDAAGYARWALAADGDPAADVELTRQLESGGSAATGAAYAAGFLPTLSPKRENALRRLAADEPAAAQSAAFARWALSRHHRIDAAEIRRWLWQLPGDAPEKVLRFHLAALGETGDRSDLTRLAGWLTAPHPETANAAAGAILAIARRTDAASPTLNRKGFPVR